MSGDTACYYAMNSIQLVRKPVYWQSFLHLITESSYPSTLDAKSCGTRCRWLPRDTCGVVQDTLQCVQPIRHFLWTYEKHTTYL
jgi:hypothetical protein